MTSRIILLVVTLVVVPISFVGAEYPREMFLQHIPTFAGIAMLGVCALRYPLSTISLSCCIVFLWLHILGARWIYSFVPYDDVSAAITGSTLSERFGWERNHYDRFIHFAFGLLGIAPISEFLQRVCRTTALHSSLLAIGGVLAVGAIYEILEWQIAITLSPRLAESYNGQQGDVWDPQKDMALAWLGGTISAALLFRWSPAN